jgi:hypothetical protein
MLWRLRPKPRAWCRRMPGSMSSSTPKVIRSTSAPPATCGGGFVSTSRETGRRPCCTSKWVPSSTVAAAPPVGEGDDGLGGADRADAGSGGQSGGQVVDDRGQIGAVGLERAGRLAQRQGEPADLGVAYGLLTGGACGGAVPGQPTQDGVAEAGAGQVAVGVIPVAEQRAEPVGLRGAGGGQLVPGAQQNAQSFAVAVGAGVGSRSAWSCSALNTARCASIGSDLPLPRRVRPCATSSEWCARVTTGGARRGRASASAPTPSSPR